MRRLIQYFVRGLVVTTPVALTGWICWWAVTSLDNLLPLGFPGAGLLLTIVVITLVGALASNFVTRGVLNELERILEGVPFVRLVYTSTKDLINAFVGERRRFNRPVRIRLDDTLDVYMPWSYSFAGRLALVPADHVQPLAADATDMLAFIISGGVTSSAEPPAKR